MIIRQATIQDTQALDALFAEARATIAALGIDQWQNGYPADYDMPGFSCKLCNDTGYVEAKLNNNEGDSANIKRNLLISLQKQLAELRTQEEKQYELLEKGIYSEELFEKRNNALRDKMEAVKKQIRETKESIPKEVDYAEKILSLKKAIESLKDDSIEPVVKNKLLKAIVKRIDFSTDLPRNRKRNSPFYLDIYLLL